MDYTNLIANKDVNVNGLIYDLGSLSTYLEKVADPRHAKGKRYPLAMLLVLFLLAKARRFFNAKPKDALRLILSANTSTL